MKTSFLFLAFFSFSLSCVTPLSTQQTIVLKDGTVLKGQVVEMLDGKYHIKTPHMGTVVIDESNLSHINTSAPMPSLGGTDGFNPPAEMAPHLQQAQEQMMNDPQVKAGVMDLAADPEIQKILQDPQLMQTLMSMDPEKMQNDPKVQQLLNNPKIQQLIQMMQQNTGK